MLEKNMKVLQKYRHIVLAVLTAGYLCYHHTIHYISRGLFTYPLDSCGVLFTDGYFKNASLNSWQPRGCYKVGYDTADTQTCFKHRSKQGNSRNITFMGDSRVRHMYHELVYQINQKKKDRKPTHHDLHFADENIGINVNFVWAPFVDETQQNMYDDWIKRITSLDLDNVPEFIITGAGSWAIVRSNNTDESVYEYKQNLKSILPLLQKLQNHTTIVWMLQEDFEDHKKPVLKNELVPLFNEVTTTLLQDTHVYTWRTLRDIQQHSDTLTKDGIHLPEEVLKADIELLLNLVCNKYMDLNESHCCTGKKHQQPQIINNKSFLGWIV